MKKQRRSLPEEYIMTNRVRILISICFVFFGILCGCAIFFYGEDRHELNGKLYEIIERMNLFDGRNIFLHRIKENLIVCVVFYICSFFGLGAYISYLYVMLRCAAYGFSNCAFISAYGLDGIYAVFLGVMPYMIFYIMSLIIFCVETTKQSRYTYICTDRNLKRKSAVTYFALSLIPIVFMTIGSIVEGFVSPHFILWCLKKV